jgi:beta-glucosidase
VAVALLAVTTAVALVTATPAPARAQDAPSAPGGAADPTLEARVDALLARLTADEKLALLGGVDFFDVPGNARLGIPRLATADGPFGVRADGPGTIYAGGIALAASWNPGLAERVGAQIGRDARARGKHYSLGPGVNIYRAPLNGRNFEYFGEDPWLASRVAVAYVRGVQSEGVSATIKHFAANNSEFARHEGDARVDERTLREIYLPAFEAAVQEGDVGAIMPGYNRLNGHHLTANRWLLTDLAKQEWGFRGVMMSDWGAVHDAAGAATAGTDLEMPGPQYFHPDSLRALVRAGTVTQAMLDDKVRRLLRNQLRFGWAERPGADPAAPRFNEAGRQLALEGAREGMVLLKNDAPSGGATGAAPVLPLDARALRRVAVVGPHAHPTPVLGGGSASVQPFHTVSVVEGLARRLGPDVAVTHARGIPSLARAANLTAFTTAPTAGQPGVTVEVFENAGFGGAPVSTRVERVVHMGKPLDFASLFDPDVPPLAGGLAFGARPQAIRFTGWYTPARAGAHDVFVQQGGFDGAGARLLIDDRVVFAGGDDARAIVEQATVTLDARPHKVVLEYQQQGPPLGGPFVRLGIVRQGAWVDPAAVRLAADADVVVVPVGTDAQTEAEGWDRSFRLPPGQDELIAAVLAANPRAVVVLTGGGASDLTRWVDRAPALVQAWFAGQEVGTALAELLVGDANFSGHLPATFERRWEDNPVHASYHPVAGTQAVPYTEGVFVGYRGHDRAGSAPLFPFGHGLSYTSFAFANLAVTPAPGSTAADPRWSATFDVTNTGARAGAAVAQLYVSDGHASVPRPAKELRGFAKVALAPGETRRVMLPLDLRALAWFDVAGRQWRADAGTFTVRVGGSSAALPLTAPLVLARTTTRAVTAPPIR